MNKEARKRLLDALNACHTIQASVPDLRLIVGMRNRIIHGYNVVDNKVVWDTVHNDLPRLTEQLKVVLR